MLFTEYNNEHPEEVKRNNPCTSSANEIIIKEMLLTSCIGFLRHNQITDKLPRVYHVDRKQRFLFFFSPIKA